MELAASAPAPVETYTLSQSLEKTGVVNDIVCRAITPAAFRDNRSLLRMGHFLAALPGIILFLPLVMEFFNRQQYGVGGLLVLILTYTLVLSFGLVAYGKDRFTQIFAILDEIHQQGSLAGFKDFVQKTLSIENQVLAGVIFAGLSTLFSQLLGYANQLSPLAWVSLSLSLAYVGFFTGTGLYFALCIPVFLLRLGDSRFRISAMLPFQTPELIEIAEISSSYTFTGGVLASLLTIFFILLELVSKAFVSMVWNSLILLILLISWFCILMPFIASQVMLGRIIKNAKKERLTGLNQAIDNLLTQVQYGDCQPIENLERMQKLSESIFHSPNSVLSFNIIGKFASSVAMTLIPFLLNMIFG